MVEKKRDKVIMDNLFYLNPGASEDDIRDTYDAIIRRVIQILPRKVGSDPYIGDYERGFHVGYDQAIDSIKARLRGSK